MQHIKIYSEHNEALNYVLTQQHVKELVCDSDNELNLHLVKDLLKEWRKDESFLLRLAFSLYGIEGIKVDLNRIEKLSQSNREIALMAIRIRYHLI